MGRHGTTVASARQGDNRAPDGGMLVRMRSSCALPAAVVFTAALASCAAKASPIKGTIAHEIRDGFAHGQRTFDHGVWDGLLRRHVRADGRVDYWGFRRERATLDRYLASVGAADLRSLGRNEQLALFINAYNACTVRTILDGVTDDELPHSIRDLHDPWGRPTCFVAGDALSLNDIEHHILRAIFRDARIHAAINCASRGCPALAPAAFRGDRVTEQLDARMRIMVADSSKVRVANGRLRLSRIFRWYRKDFTNPTFAGSGSSLVAVVRRNAPASLRTAIDALGPDPKISFLPYDWTLNGL